jgi:hypothetical protein
MEYLLDPAKRAGVNYEGDAVIRSKIESAQTTGKKLKESLGIDGYKVRLRDARAAVESDRSETREQKQLALADLEKEICNKMLLEIGRYPWTDIDTSNAPSEPAKMLATKRMICTGKSVISHEFLEELGIRHDALSIPGHIALMVYLSDGKEYVFDPTNGTELATLSNGTELSGFSYGETTQSNAFASSAGIELPRYRWLYAKDDSEFGLMGALYGNKAYYERGVLSPGAKLRLYQRALEMKPNGLQANINLMHNYIELRNYEKTIELGEKILKRMESIASPAKTLLSDSANSVYGNLLKAYSSTHDNDSVIKL